MIKRILILSLISLISILSKAQQDSALAGTWNLFKIIDNMTGDEILPPSDKPNFRYTLTFADSVLKYNLDINKCNLDYLITGPHEITFPHYSECTLICCDKEFSALLTYEECNRYYIKNEHILVLISEDRIFYFSNLP